jgi:hypothetical protein
LKKLSVGLKTAFATEALLLEVEWLEERLNIEKLCIFLAGARIPKR